MLLQVVLFVFLYDYSSCDLLTYDLLNTQSITWYMVCCAKCHFLPFLPFLSKTYAPSQKMLPVTKTPTNSTFHRYRLILPAFVGFPTKFFDLWSQAENFSIVSIDCSTICSTLRITRVARFGKHNPLYHFTYYQKSYNLIINIIASNIIYQI